MADWNNPNPINTNPGGDTKYQGFIKAQSNFDDIYSKLNTVKKLQTGTTAPSNPAVGELWFDENTGILKRYDGTSWVEIVALPDLSNTSNITVLNKIKNVDGSGSGLDADLVRGLPADFTSSLASSGYQKLPSGLIIQWGSISKPTASPVSVIFPIAFPNACLTIVDSQQYTDNTGNKYSLANITTAGFDIVGTGVGGVGFYCYWVSIGY